MASTSSSLALSFSTSFHTLKIAYLLSISSSKIQLSKPPIHQPLIAKPASIASHKNLGIQSRSTMADLSTHSNQKVELFDSEELAIELAKCTPVLSKKIVKERGAFTVVVSVGSLIKLLRKLTETSYVEAERSKWRVFWVDKRVVLKDDPESKYKLAFDGFCLRQSVLMMKIVDILELF